MRCVYNIFKMKCAYCSHLNVKGSKYCGVCGVNLSYYHHQAVVESSDRTTFWGGERRYVTVLFIKLMGIESMVLKTSIQNAFIFLRKWFEEIEEVIFRFGGINDAIFTESRTLGIFGAPKTHMDDPIKAVQGALKIKERWLSSDDVPENIYLRVGINSGLVFFGKIHSMISPFTVIGDTVNVASRIEEIALPNQILVSENTHNHLKGLFVTELIPSQRIRGREGLMEIFEIKDLREGASAKGTEEIPLIGRDKEIAQLKSAVESLMPRGSKLVSVAGEIGTGKTRLKEELGSWLATKRNILYYEADCIALGHQVPYHSFVRFLKNFFGVTETDTPIQIHEKILKKLKSIGVEEDNILPIVEHFLSVDKTELASLAKLDPETYKEQVYAAIRKILQRSTQTSALIICFEDFHLIDPSSLQLLTYLVTELTERPILFLLLHHPEGVAKMKMSNQEEIRLGGLNTNAIHEYVKKILATNFLSNELASFVEYSTGGNPLFIRELIQFCKHKRAIYYDDGAWHFNKSRVERDFPHSIYEALMEGLDTLDDKKRLIVDYASVIGQAFNYRVLTQITNLKDIELDLKDLCNMGHFLQAKAGSDPEYVFRHTLLKDVAYNTLPLKRRKELHKAVGQVIEGLYSEKIPEFYEQLAFQFYHSEDFYKAIDYYKLAGDKAKILFANDNAIYCYNKIKEIMELLVIKEDKYHDLRVDTLFNLCDVYELVSDYEKMLSEAKIGLEQVRQERNFEKEAAFLEKLSLSCVYLGRYKDANESLAAALDISKAKNFFDLLASIYADLGYLNAKELNYEMSIFHYNLGYNIALEHKNMRGVMKCLLNLSMLHKDLGNYQLTLDYLKNALAFSISNKSRRDEVAVKNYLGEIYLMLGDYAKANRWLREAFDFAGEISFMEMIVVTAMNICQLNIALDNREKIRQWLEFLEAKEIFGISKEAGRWVELTKASVVKSLGWEDEARDKISDLIEKCQAARDKKIEVQANLLMAAIDLKSIHWARNGLQLAEEINLPWLIWRSYYAMGRSLLENNQKDAALDMFQRAQFIVNDLKERIREEELRNSFTNLPEIRYLFAALEAK